MSQQILTHIEKDAISKNSTIIYHDYNIGDKVMVRKTRLINTKQLFKVRM